MNPEELFRYLGIRGYTQTNNARMDGLSEVEIQFWQHTQHAPVLVRYNQRLQYIEVYQLVDASLMELAF